MYDRQARIIAVHDGDTITVVLDQGFYDTKQITVRLLGVYAPELSQVGGLDSGDFVRNWVKQYTLADVTKWSFLVTTSKGPRSGREQTTLSRYLATVETIDRAHNLNVDIEAYVTGKNYPGGMGSS